MLIVCKMNMKFGFGSTPHRVRFIAFARANNHYLGIISMQKIRSSLLAFVAATLFSTSAQAVNCESIKNAQQRLACYDSAAQRKPGGGADTSNSKNNCRGFEIASNTLKLSLESGTLRNDMLASGISELIAKREECRIASNGQQDKPTYEKNLNAFQDIYQALRVAEHICRTDPIAQAIGSCSPDMVTLTSGGATYGCQEFYKPIPRHALWIQEHCGGRYTASNLISFILKTEVTSY